MIHLVTQQMSPENLLCAGPYDIPWGYRGEPDVVLDLTGFTDYSLLLKNLFCFSFHETTLSMFPPAPCHLLHIPST